MSNSTKKVLESALQLGATEVELLHRVSESGNESVGLRSKATGKSLPVLNAEALTLVGVEVSVGGSSGKLEEGVVTYRVGDGEPRAEVMVYDEAEDVVRAQRRLWVQLRFEEAGQEYSFGVGWTEEVKPKSDEDPMLVPTGRWMPKANIRSLSDGKRGRSSTKPVAAESVLAGF